MKRNMGMTDKVIRVILALVFGALYFTGTVEGVLGLVLLVLGAVFLLTALLNFCPLYLPFNISTFKEQK